MAECDAQKQMSFSLELAVGAFPSGILCSVAAPNTSCTRLVGVCAFSGSLVGSKLVPSKWRDLVPPTSG